MLLLCLNSGRIDGCNHLNNLNWQLFFLSKYLLKVSDVFIYLLLWKSWQVLFELIEILRHIQSLVRFIIPNLWLLPLDALLWLNLDLIRHLGVPQNRSLILMHFAATPHDYGDIMGNLPANIVWHGVPIRFYGSVFTVYVLSLLDYLLFLNLLRNYLVLLIMVKVLIWSHSCYILN